MSSSLAAVLLAVRSRELTRYQLRVALCEKEVEVGFGAIKANSLARQSCRASRAWVEVGFGATKANSGIIHGGHCAAPDTFKGRLEWEGNQLWDALAQELHFGFRRVGELTVALHAIQLPALDKLLHHAALKGAPGVELWSPERIRCAEPALSPAIIAAVYAPTTGVVNPYQACYALAESAVHNGLTLLTGFPVELFRRRDDGWEVITPGVRLTSRYLINAAGLYADKIAGLAGVRTFTIQPRKGEEYLLDKRLQGLVKHVIFPCPSPVSKGILIIPTYDGTLMVGPTAEDTPDRADLRTSAHGAQTVFAAVGQLVAGISDKDVIVQCLHDFDIPLHLSTTIVEIHGDRRVNKVTVAPVDAALQPCLDRAWEAPCDTVLVSIGLIPENELSQQMRLRLDPVTRGPMVTSVMECTRNGVFACGNVVHIHDIVDFVSAEAALAGFSAGQFVTGALPPPDNVRLQPGENVAYCVPHTISTEREHTVYLRARRPLDASTLRLVDGAGAIVYEKRLRYVFPAEMVNLKLRPAILQHFHGDVLRVELVRRTDLRGESTEEEAP